MMMSLIDKLLLSPFYFSLLTCCCNGSMFLDSMVLFLLISKVTERLGIPDWSVMLVDPPKSFSTSYIYCMWPSFALFKFFSLILSLVLSYNWTFLHGFMFIFSPEKQYLINMFPLQFWNGLCLDLYCLFGG